MGELLDEEKKSTAQTLEATGGALLRNYRGGLLRGMYSGFPDVASASSALKVSTDAPEVNFGPLVSGFFARGQSQLVINSNIPAGYKVYILQDRPMQLASLPAGTVAPLEREMIGGTKCDDDQCSVSKASKWSKPEKAGMGYTVTGVDADTDFDGGSQYRQLPTMSNGESMVQVAEEKNVTQTLVNRSLAVQYQVAVSPANEAGLYTNAVILTVIPNF
jgi:hypothetical protein